MPELMKLPEATNEEVESINLNSKSLIKTIIRLVKQDIFERFKQIGEVTNEDWEFCERIDWHPVDELSPKPEHVKEVKRRRKNGKFIKFNSASEIFDEK